MIYAYRTDIGRRNSNQDSFYIPSAGTKSVVMVADGMGGHKAGNVASLIAIEAARRYIEDGSPNIRKTMLMQHAVNHANTDVHEAAKTEGCEGMGTTLVIAYLEEDMFCCANVGDSRLYHYDGNQLMQVTNDHSLVEELASKGAITREQIHSHPLRHVLTRAVGTEEYVKADIFLRSWKHGDVLLLCSDGLHGVVPDSDILWALQNGKDLFECCDLMVDFAEWYGSTDNITVILAKNDCNFDNAEAPNRSDEPGGSRIEFEKTLGEAKERFTQMNGGNDHVND